MGFVGGDGGVSVRVEDCVSLVGAMQVEMGEAVKMSKERLAGRLRSGSRKDGLITRRPCATG